MRLLSFIVKPLYIKKIYISKFNPINKITFGSWGKNSYIYKPDFVTGKKNIHIGEHVSILNNARIEVITEWDCGENKQVFHPIPTIYIDDNVSIEGYLHMACASGIHIGEGTVISSRVFISDCSHNINNITEGILNQRLDGAPINIGKGCFIGIGSIIKPGISIGDYAVIGAGTIVDKSVDAYSMVVGNPLRVIKRYNTEKKVWENV